MELSASAWGSRLAIGLVIIALGTLYGRGWSNRQTDLKPPQRWQTATFVLGLSLAGFTLISEFATIAHRYYSVREIQHILITGLVPLLLLVSDPIVTLAAGLPTSMSKSFYALNDPKRHSYQLLRRITSPGLIWVMFVTLFWLWHDPTLMQATRKHGWIHAIEIGSLMLVALLYWWQIAEVRPRLHRPMKGLVKLSYVFMGMLPIKLLGIFLLFGSETIAGAAVTHETADLVKVGNLIIADKSLGALILWVMGGFTYTYSAIFLAGRQLGIEEAKPVRPISVLEEDETWRAPAIRR